jgi:hypothetical protein
MKVFPPKATLLPETQETSEKVMEVTPECPADAGIPYAHLTDEEFLLEMERAFEAECGPGAPHAPSEKSPQDALMKARIWKKLTEKKVFTGFAE